MDFRNSFLCIEICPKIVFSVVLFQFMDEDCTLEEEEDGPVEDEDEIDRYNDDTFGAGAIGEYYWKLNLICYLFTVTLHNTFSSYVTPAYCMSKYSKDPESHNGYDLLWC